MRFSDLVQLFSDTPVFSTQELLLLDDSFNRENLFHRQKSWKIIQLKRWRYVIADRLRSEKDLYHIASRIVQPSYISLETALSLYNLIPEAVIQVTSITTKKTQQIHSATWSYIYRSIHPSIFWWYELHTWETWSYYLASIEKAILDYLYYHNELDNKAAFQQWRILASEFHEQVDRDLFDQHLERFDNKAMKKRVTLFLDFIDHA